MSSPEWRSVARQMTVLASLLGASALFACVQANRGGIIMSATQTKPSEVAQEFVKRINAHDLEAIAALMAPNYVFVDSLGNDFPSAMARDGWKQYFGMVPDYWIKL